ncbi:3-deoxy-manno-octulosonate cytidylyltransferase [compost metagenome]
MRTVAIIQARMGSTRLPGKILLPLGDRTVLEHVVARTRACPLIDEVVVATTTSPQDDALVPALAAMGVSCFRGSEEDVLARYYQAAEHFRADVVVRITSDCPLFDPQVLTRMLEAFRGAEPPCDYLSNTLTRTYPRGLDAEMFTFEALARAHAEAREPYEREHVTPFLYFHPDRFALRDFRGEGDASEHRWTLDTDDDYRLIQALYAALYRPGEIFTTEEALAHLALHPQLALLNAHVEQKKVREGA